ncbi:hypothetical protein UA08_08214 [Talaromyces atroroseus]|uniref:ubiquitinyl hydrolase 1 n=1 Tax=Talaromyces atroroseus TaxID=1441469 RepID=A0A225AHS2_TALAT|nr:hypothetical protein UA08_08214 [Talaromyces atroroseus]OKL56628.1 hypothetical protein UA08_08214 [Talaromyces atroroseus]
MTESIKENWEGYHVLHTLISLTARVLSLTSNNFQDDCLKVLLDLRQISLSWIKTLKQKVQDSIVDTHRQELSKKAVLIALICMSSFDVDPAHLHAVLSEPHNLSVLIQISIIIEEDRNCITSTLDPLALILHDNSKRLLLRTSTIILEFIHNITPSALNHAILQSWSGYPGGASWGKVSEKEVDWLFTETAQQIGGDSLAIHYNIITGELLVNGDRLSRLSTKYEQHPTYRVLFGYSSLEIMPSGLPGMRYSTKKDFAEHTVHFGLSSETSAEYDLVIHAIHENQTLELVPSRLELPNRIHVTHLASTSTIEIDLPLLNLSFNRPKSGQKIQSRQFRGFSIGEHQGCGTLMNFQNKLVLTHEEDEHELVLLLEGQLNTTKTDDHIVVRVNQLAARKKKLLVYLRHGSIILNIPKRCKGDLIRPSTFRISGFGAELSTKSYDRKYEGRDLDQDSESGKRVFVSTHLTYHERGEICDALERGSISELWKFLAKSSLTLHAALQNKTPRNKFRVMLWLSSLAFSEEANMLVIQILSLFYTLKDMRQVSIPTASRFYLSRGCDFRSYELKTFIESSIRPMIECPEGDITQGSYETPYEFQTRREISYVNNQELATESISDSILSERNAPSTFTNSLKQLVEDLSAHAKSPYENDYVAYLRKSLQTLQENPAQDFSLTEDSRLVQNLKENLLHHRSHLASFYSRIVSAVKQADAVVNDTTSRNRYMKIVMNVGHGPRFGPSHLLRYLRAQLWSSVPGSWQHAIVSYGLAFSGTQRAHSLVESIGNRKKLTKEICNRGHENWDPERYTDSLLLELENNLRIRNVQEEIAREMRDRPTGGNAVMQLNIGEGKSFVIVPIVAAALADSSRSVRIIVAKPQSKQMFEMLILKLAGMLGRRIYRLPFSRALKINSAQAQEIFEMCQECMKNRGVLLVQPEQILSLKLMCLESFRIEKDDVGEILLKTQALFNQYARDIVDESDENFSVKFELIYTNGQQRPVQFSPDRWMVIHQILDMVRDHLAAVKSEFPRVEIARCPWELNEQEAQAVEKDSTEFWGETTREMMLLLRGILAGGILSFAFGQKRWRVNYGLTSARQPPTKLAVPYRAKDNPTTRSEFSHPDVVILLTSLSYYYAGLQDDDLFDAFNHLLRADQADVEYQIWVRDADCLPKAFHQIVGINLKDRYLCTEKLFPCYRFAKSVTDYFLRHIVFPKEMKGFPHKLSASGWDLGQITDQPTTGFSGTNDSRRLLPIDVKQLDLPEQMHTNALVLNYLLQPENEVVQISSADGQMISKAQSVLALAMQHSPPIQVILDVGAQILELSNVKFATEWLKQSSHHTVPEAIVFFDDDDNLCVVDRKGRVELLQTSPFGKHLDARYVFLDEAHTRGTDLELPVNYRAAVTLGADITKDRLVQGMRMRKLGHGQSVVFCVPDEIQYKIREQTGKVSPEKIDVSDVLSWAIRGTWEDTKKSIPLWAAQGERFVSHARLWDEIAGHSAMSSEQAKSFLEEEAQSLEQRYQPGWKTDRPDPSEKLQGDSIYSEIVSQCKEFHVIAHHSARMNEEQERELSPEVQQERQVQKPPRADPAKHYVHSDLKRFITSGILLDTSSAFRPAFEALARTSAAEFPRDLFVTADFCETIIPSDPSSFLSDWYQRSVQWVLSSRNEGTDSDRSTIIKQMVIISPFEANELYDLIQNSRYVTIHLYGPRFNLGAPALDRLDLYNVSNLRSDSTSIPPTLVIQLNLFAGQLYFSSFGEYVRVCEFLGVAWESREDLIVDADGFIRKSNNGRKNTSTFQHSPIKFLKVMISKIRKNGEDIEKTHIGKLFDGMILCPRISLAKLAKP